MDGTNYPLVSDPASGASSFQVLEDPTVNLTESTEFERLILLHTHLVQ